MNGCELRMESVGRRIAGGTGTQAVVERLPSSADWLHGAEAAVRLVEPAGLHVQLLPNRRGDSSRAIGGSGFANGRTPPGSQPDRPHSHHSNSVEVSDQAVGTEAIGGWAQIRLAPNQISLPRRAPQPIYQPQSSSQIARSLCPPAKTELVPQLRGPCTGFLSEFQPPGLARELLCACKRVLHVSSLP